MFVRVLKRGEREEGRGEGKSGGEEESIIIVACLSMDGAYLLKHLQIISVYSREK